MKKSLLKPIERTERRL